ncbi:MAG: hypothetical protein ABJA70_16755 [Chryseolinea sp.]
MITRFWMIIKDDAMRTFEVYAQEANDNAFTNRTVAMQRSGMNVSCITPPVTHKNGTKTMVKVPGYTLENGLYERLVNRHREIIMKAAQDEY